MIAKPGQAETTPEATPAPLLLTVEESATAIAMSTRWLWRATSAGDFPQPVRIGRATRWRRSDIEEWVASLDH